MRIRKGIESRLKKPRVSDEKIEPGHDAPENQWAIVEYTGGGEPVNSVKIKKPRQPRETIHNGPKPNPEIPSRFKNMIENFGGKDWSLVIQKGLCRTDLSRSHCRLSIPTSLWNPKQGLPSELVRMLDSESENIGKTKTSVSLPLIDTKMRFWEAISLKKWNMSKATYVICGGWNDVAAANDLKLKDVIQIWCFKFIETGKFGLAMVKIQDGTGNDNVEIGSNSDSQMQPSSCVLSLGIHPHSCNSAGSSTSSNPNHCQCPSTTYFDFMNVESHNAMIDSDSSYVCDQESVQTHQIAGSESSNNGNFRLGGSSAADGLVTVTYFPHSDIDLDLHL